MPSDVELHTPSPLVECSCTDPHAPLTGRESVEFSILMSRIQGIYPPCKTRIQETIGFSSRANVSDTLSPFLASYMRNPGNCIFGNALLVSDMLCPQKCFVKFDENKEDFLNEPISDP
jgi:hypothetical protein